MKKIIIFVCMAVVSLSSFAQFEQRKNRAVVNHPSSSSAKKSSRFQSNKKKEGIVAWHYVEAGYDYNHMANNIGGYARNFNMGNFGYHIAFNTFSATPNLKVETGLNYAFGKSNNDQNILEVFVNYVSDNKDHRINVDYSVSYLKLPILASYKAEINDNITLIPQIGFYAKCYLTAKDKTYTDDEEVKKAYKHLGWSFGETNRFDLETADWNWRRFGCGLQAGVNCIIKDHFLIGANYSYELTKIDPEFGYNFTHDVNVKAGWVF